LGPCKTCDSSIAFCNGGDEYLPKEGHWKFNATADIIHTCLAAGCLGYKEVDGRLLDEFEDQGCAEGYKGNLCNNCIDGYGKNSDKTECFDCDKNPNIWLQLTVVIIVTLVLVGNQVKQTNEGLEDFHPDEPEKDVEGVNSVLMRTLTTFLSMTSIV